MDECISRNKAINAIKSLESSMPAKDNYAKGYDAALGRALIAVREVPPTTDVQPVKHGRWIRTDKSMGVETAYACSECGYLVRECDRTNYCGDCGSKMDIVYQDDKVTAIKVTGW